MIMASRASSGGYSSKRSRLAGTNDKEAVAINQKAVTETAMSPQALQLTREGKIEELKTLAMKTQNQCLRDTDDKGRSLLHLASESGATDIMQYLIDSGAVHLNAQDEDGNTALHLAVESSQVGAVDLLLKLGASDTIKNHAEDPPLHIALSKKDSRDLVCTFTKHPINLIVRGYHDHTSLHVIAEHDNLEALEILHNVTVARNQDQGSLQLHAVDKQGMTAVHLAARKGSHRVLDFMISEAVHHGAGTPQEVLEYLNEENSTPIHQAIESGHLKVVEVLLKYGASPVATRGNHLPPIHLACSQNRLGMVKAMVEKFGPDILKCRDHKGRTPLHSSSSSLCSTDMFSYLLEHGSDLDPTDDGFYTPLHDAIILGNLPAVDFFLNKGSNPLIRNKKGHNCLHTAVAYKRKEVFKKMVETPEASRLSEEPDLEGNYPIHLVLKLGLNSYILPLLKSAEVPLYDTQHNNYLHLAARAGDYTGLLSILSSDFSSTMLNELNSKGQSPLHSAAISGNVLVIKELVDRGAVVHKCHRGRTPFMYACSLGQFEAAKALYQAHPFQRDWVDNEGNTALHLAVEGGEPDTMSFCLDTGMVITLNNAGLSFLDKILKKVDEKLACAAVSHERWQECLDVSSPRKLHPILRLIARIPEAFELVLNKSIEKSSLDSHHPNYWEEYNFKYLILDPMDRKVQSPEDQGRQACPLEEDGNRREKPQQQQQSSLPEDQHNIQLHMENPITPEIAQAEGCNADGSSERVIEKNTISTNVQDSEIQRDLEPAAHEHTQVTVDTPLVAHSGVQSTSGQTTQSEGKIFQYPHPNTVDHTEHNKPHPGNAKISPSRVLMKLVKLRREACLTHPVVVTYLNLKWNGYARWLYLSQFTMVFLFTIFLSAFIWITPSPTQSTDPNENATETGFSLSSNAIRFTTLLLAVVNMLLWATECYVLGKHLFTYFIKEFRFWSIGFSLVCTFIFLIPWRGLDTVLWEAGAFAAFFAWISVTLYLQLSDIAGIYVNMLVSTTKNVLKVLLMVFLFVCAFAFPLYILVGTALDRQYSTVGRSLFSVFGSLLALVDYADLVVAENASELQFSVLVYIFYIILSIVMPIVVINLLVGIAVGDIANIQEEAIVSRHILKVDALSKLHKILPTTLVTRIIQRTYKRYPNRERGTIIARLWHRFFAQDEEIEEEVALQQLEEIKEKQTHEEELATLKMKVEELASNQLHQTETLERVENMLAKLMELQRVPAPQE